MSGDSQLKHRHDIGHPDHGATATEGITRAVQGVLAACIVLTLALVAYSLWVAGG